MADNNDLTIATRELFVRSVVDQVFMKTPFIDDLQKRRKITYSGGKYVERLVDTAEIDDLYQEYSANEPLTDDRKTTLDKPRFTMKLGQLPLKYDVDEELQNVHADDSVQLLDLAEHLTKKAQRGMKLRLMKMVFNDGSTTARSDSSKFFQSLVSALDHDATYGTLTRSWSAGTRDWFQGADPAALNESVSSSAQDTATNLSVSNLRKWINESSISHNMESEEDLYIYMCPTLWDKLAAEMESRTRGYETGDSQNQSIRKLKVDGHTAVSVPYLQTTSTMRSWLFILNLQHWELRLHTRRNFKMTDFKWQGDVVNGYDFYLSRILLAGNLVCWKPNSSMWLSAVS